MARIRGLRSVLGIGKHDRLGRFPGREEERLVMTADEAREATESGHAVVCCVCCEIVMRARDVSDVCCTEDAPEIVDATYRLMGDTDNWR